MAISLMATLRAVFNRTNGRTLGLMVILAVAAVLLLCSLPGRGIHVDDSWFAEQAYWLVKDGVVRSEILSGVLGYGERQFVYHKLHIWQSALIIELFGLNLYALKAIPLFYFLLFTIILWVYLERFHRAPRELFLFSLVLIVSNGLLVEHVFVNRPEIMLMCLGFGSFLFLRLAMEQGAVVMGMLAGGFAGLAGLTHLNGLAFAAAGAVLLLVYKQYRLLGLYAAGSLIGMGAYFVELLSVEHIAKFWHQFRNDPALSENEFDPWGLLTKLLLEPKRYFNHLLEGSYSLMAIVVLLWQRRSLVAESESRMVLLYLAFLIVLIGLMTPGKKNIYLLYHMPYVVILLGLAYRHVLDNGTRAARSWAIGLLCFFLLVNFGDSFRLIQNSGIAPQTVARVIRQFGIEQGDKVMAPHLFVFAGLDRLDLYGVGSVFIPARQGTFELTSARFFQEAKRRHREYVILERGHLRRLGITELEPEQNLHGYAYRGSVGPFHVLQLAGRPVAD